MNLSAFMHLMHKSQSQLLHLQHSMPLAMPKPVMPDRQKDAPLILSQAQLPLWLEGRFLTVQFGCDRAMHISSNCRSCMNSTGIEAIYASTGRLGKLTKSKFRSIAGASSILLDGRGLHGRPSSTESYYYNNWVGAWKMLTSSDGCT